MKHTGHSRRSPSRTRVSVLVACSVVFFFALFLTTDPERRWGFLRDAERRDHVRSILFFLETERLHKNGAVPNGIDATFETFQLLGTTSHGCEEMCGAVPTESACLLLASSTFVLPKDPVSGTEERSGYAVNRTASGRFEVVACDPERAREIRLRR